MIKEYGKYGNLEWIKDPKANNYPAIYTVMTDSPYGWPMVAGYVSICRETPPSVAVECSKAWGEDVSVYSPNMVLVSGKDRKEAPKDTPCPVWVSPRPKASVCNPMIWNRARYMVEPMFPNLR